MTPIPKPPQLITGARMLYLVWIPAEPDAVAALVPDGLTAAPRSLCYVNQYVVERADAISTPEFGSYSLTYLGVDLDGLDTEAGTPARWWTHYLNSSEPMSRYAVEHGVPAGAGRTTLELAEGRLVATTFVDGVPTIRTTAAVEVGTTQRATGQLRYVTQVRDELVSGRYPYVADLAERFTVESLEFLDEQSSTYVLRPADPLEVTFGFYSPAISFCYPGGEGPLGGDHGS
jgi:hypothetical protein